MYIYKVSRAEARGAGSREMLVFLVHAKGRSIRKRLTKRDTGIKALFRRYEGSKVLTKRL